MRNSFKGFFSSNFPKFQIVKFNPNGHNSAMRLNLFSNANVKKDSIYNAIIIPTFDNKAFYSNFTYKYFNLKWTKFEQKANYYKYVKTPSQFPNFLVSTNYFINSFLKRRRKKRVYKKRRIRFSVYFTSRFLRSSKSIFRSYRLRPFYGKKKKVFRLRKKLLRSLARKKTFRVLFRKYWIRRRWYKRSKFFYKKARRKFNRFQKFHKKNTRYPKKSKKRFYFKRRTYRFKVFRFFRFKKNLKKIRYARRYAYRKARGFRKIRFAKSKNLAFRISNYAQANFTKKIFRLRFFKRLARRVIRRRYFFNYVRTKLSYKIRSRIFYNKFGLFRFLGFKNYLLHNYFGANLTFSDPKVFVSNPAKFAVFNFFKYFFLYPQKLLYSKNIFYFKFFSSYNILKANKLKRFSTYFRLNFVQYYYFYKTFNDFFNIISVFKINFIPFNFKLGKKSYLPKFNSRISALQYLQRRKLVRNLRFCTYFLLFTRVLQLKRGTRFYRRMIKKLMKFIYRRTRTGRIYFFLPFLLNRFVYFGLLSHVNTNIYLRDPIKFNDFYSTKTKKSKFILRTKI